MGVIGAGASAGGAIKKYKDTKGGKKEADTEVLEYTEEAEKNGILIEALMTGLPRHIIEQMFKCQSIPEEERAWLKNMAKNFLAAKDVIKVEKKDLNQEMVVSSVIGAREGYHAVKDGKKLVEVISTAVAPSDAAATGTDVAVAAASVGFGAMKTATATVGSVFLIWDTYNMIVGINDLVNKKPSDAGEFLRRQADDLYPTCALCDRHTFYNVPECPSSSPELCNCFALEDDWVVDWLGMTKHHPRYERTTEAAREVVQKKLPITCKACNQKTATEKGMKAHVLWLHGRETLDVKEQLMEAVGHNLFIRTYSKPTFCHHCKKLLWGTYNQASLLILSQPDPYSSGPALFHMWP